jgi:ectoine hydroxylase-related dioxygenase (phytanoyl-CoA dioxygenase family)
VCAAVTAEVERAWRQLDPRLLVELGGSYHDLAPELRARHFKLLDLYFWSPEVRRAAFAPPLLEFLRLVFAREPLLFQSLSFEIGSGDPVHQDTANVVTESPLEFCAAWIALEDIAPGSGELCYYPGSHRLPEATFGPGVRNWNRRRDGKASRQEVLDGLHTRAAARGLELQRFTPKQGDVLIWSADLAHGGTPITDPALTRRSLVCHYCPLDVRPYYFAYRRRHRTLHADPSGPPGCTGARYASKHYPR